MIGTNAFKRLEIDDQIKLILEEASFAISVYANGYVNTLYTYNAFFIELKQDLITGEVIQISNFVKSVKLDKYLAKIEIEDLFE